MIEIKDLSFSFGKKKILENLCVTFKPGNFYGIIGPNGSGKTTLLKLMSGQLKADNGNILIDGININSFRRIDFAKKVAMLPQERYKASISVYDHIACGRYPYHGAFGKYGEDDDKIISECAKIAGVNEFLDIDIRYLSGGERQKVYLATVFAQETQYILFDEPTTYLDIPTSFGIMTTVKNVCKKGKCAIAVLHDISLALQYCDYILILNNNQSQMLSLQEACESSIIEDTFNIRCTVIDINGKQEYVISKK